MNRDIKSQLDFIAGLSTVINTTLNETSGHLSPVLHHTLTKLTYSISQLSRDVAKNRILDILNADTELTDYLRSSSFVKGIVFDKADFVYRPLRNAAKEDSEQSPVDIEPYKPLLDYCFAQQLFDPTCSNKNLERCHLPVISVHEQYVNFQDVDSSNFTPEKLFETRIGVSFNQYNELRSHCVITYVPENEKIMLGNDFPEYSPSIERIMDDLRRLVEQGPQIESQLDWGVIIKTLNEQSSDVIHLTYYSPINEFIDGRGHTYSFETEWTYDIIVNPTINPKTIPLFWRGKDHGWYSNKPKSTQTQHLPNMRKSTIEPLTIQIIARHPLNEHSRSQIAYALNVDSDDRILNIVGAPFWLQVLLSKALSHNQDL